MKNKAKNNLVNKPDYMNDHFLDKSPEVELLDRSICVLYRV